MLKKPEQMRASHRSSGPHRGVLMASAGLGVTVAALFWFVDPAGAIPLESWDDKIPIATNRFRVLPEFSGQAVLDSETQLVWEQSPLTTLHVWL